MLNGFDTSKWKNEGEGSFNITAEYAEIKKTKIPLARLKYCESIAEPGKTYKFSVKCESEACKDINAAYAMVSLYKEDGSSIARKYADKTDLHGVKECTFKVPEDCVKIGIELGLKGSGYVRWSKPELEETETSEKRIVRVASTRLAGAKTTAEALKNIEAVVDKAGKQNVDVIIMSEIINDLGCGLPVAETAQTTEGEYCTLMKAKARQYNTYIVMNFHEKDENGIYNTSLLIDRNGEIAGKYRKTHISFGEWEKGITPGEELPVFETDFGRVGMLICWDMYFPETARIMTLKGAELLLVSTVGDPAFRHVSRAMENGVYVAVSGSQYHNLNDCRVKPSKIIAPDGEILAQTDEVGDAAIAEIDLNDKKQMYWLSIPAAYSVPNNIYMNERRPELYKEI